MIEPAMRARLATAVAARDTADYARGLVGDVGKPLSPGDRIRAARRLRALSLAVLDSTVIQEVEAGASWAEIAQALGLNEATARARYSDVVGRWLAAEAGEGLDLDVMGARGEKLGPDEDPAGLALTIEQWYHRHAEPWDFPTALGIL